MVALQVCWRKHSVDARKINEVLVAAGAPVMGALEQK